MRVVPAVERSAIAIALTLSMFALAKSADAASTACPAPSFAGAMSFSAGVNPRGIAAGDFNGDGALDLAIANFTASGTVSILLGDGSGAFAMPIAFAAHTAPRAVVAGDFNNDGRLDVAASNQESNDVSILLGNGDGTLRAATQFPVGRQPGVLAAADFNGDGNLDLAVPNANAGLPGTVSVLLGDGAGGFTTAATLAAGTAPTAVAAADFDANGTIDLAVANQGSNDVSVFLGTGTGAFGAATSHPIPANAMSIVAGDFTGDGALDVVTLSGGFRSSTIAILPGDGAGSFAPAITHTVEVANSTSIAAADFNRDGSLDVVVGSVDDENVRVLFGDGGGGFGPAVAFAVAGSPFFVAAVDVNGDRKIDIVSTNRAGTVSILLNTCPSTPADLLADLIALVEELALDEGIANSLIAKLEAALDSTAGEQTATACNQLHAITNHVRALTGKKLTASDGERLLTAAAAISSSLRCD